MTDTPKWALDKAAKAAGSNSWRMLIANHDMNSSTWKSAEAHAETLAKYETEPVDPVLLKARELIADVYKKKGYKTMADNSLNGTYDKDYSLEAIKAALRLPAMGDNHD